MKVETQQTNKIAAQVQQLIDRAYAVMTSDPTHCIELGNTALGISQNNNYKIGIGLANQCIGSGYYHQSDYYKALQSYNEAEVVFQEEQYISGLRKIYNNIGCIYGKWNDLEKALQYYQKNLELEAQFSDPLLTCSILNNIGEIYSSLNDHKKALQYHQETLEISEQYNFNYTKSIALTNIGNEYCILKERVKAEEFLCKSITVNEATNNITCLCFSYINLSELKADTGLFDEAQTFLRKALTYAQKLDDQCLVAQSYFHFACLYSKMGEQEKQREYLEKCTVLADPNKFHSISLLAYTMLAELYEKKSDFQNSTYCYKKMQELKDFLSNEKRIIAIHESLTKIELERTERENERLRQKTNELENQNKLIVIRNTFDKLLNNNSYAQKHHMIFNSEQMDNILLLMDKIASSGNTDVMITGESGTGKELVAHGIHQLSSRRQQIFFAVNCTAVPDNLFESEFFGHTKNAFTGAISSKKGGFEIANKGTLFLDEIGDMPVHLQAKLLRVLEERKIRRVGSSEDIDLDILIIASTNQNILQKVEQNLFRTDIYYRLNKFNIHIPPLRERIDDILPLANYFANIFSIAKKITPKPFASQTIVNLLRYQYPGNVRELRNIVEKAVIMSRPDDRYLIINDLNDQHHNIDSELIYSESSELSLERLAVNEKEMIILALKKTNNNKTQAAKLLNINRRSLQRRIEKYGLGFPS